MSVGGVKYLTYLAYSLGMAVILFVGTGYVVFVLGYSPWWFALAIGCAFCCYKPDRWGQIDHNAQG